jgi:hypothetical protein
MRIGLRAFSSPRARLTLVYSRLPNKAELAVELGDDRAALIDEVSLSLDAFI